MNIKLALALVLCVMISFIFPAVGLPLSILLVGGGLYLYWRNNDTRMKRIALATIATGGFILTILLVVTLTGYGVQGKPIFSEGTVTEPVILPEVTSTP